MIMILTIHLDVGPMICNCFSIDLNEKSLVNCDSLNSSTAKWLPQSCSLTLNAFIYLGDCHLLSLFGLGSWPPYPAANLHRKNINAQGISFWSPALKHNSNCLQICSSCPYIKWKQFLFNADIYVQSVDILLLKYTPDLPPNFLPNRRPPYIYRSVTCWCLASITAKRRAVKWASSGFATRPCSFQPAQLQRLVQSESWNVVYAMFSYRLFRRANNKDADQTARKRRLICAFAVRSFLILLLSIKEKLLFL